MKSSLIHHFLEQSAKSFPSKTALIHEDTRAGYAGINVLANRLANRLVKNGIKTGDRVVILLDNSFEYVVSYYSILKTGAVAVPLSSDIKPDGLKPLLDELEPAVLISSAKFERLLKAVDLSQFKVKYLILRQPRLQWQESKIPVLLWDDIINDGPTENQNLPVKKTDLASIIYTSGSTGKPKGVMLTHNNIVSNTKSICTYLNLTDKDKQMVVLPFFYVMGKSLLNTHFAVGGTVVINNKFAFPATVLKQMEVEQVTGFSGVPSTYAYLLHRSPLADYKDRFASLRYCTQAGGHMSTQTKKELRKTLPEHTEIYIMYGATEASARLTYLEPDKFTKKIDSIGRAIPGVSIKIIDKNGKNVSTGQTGELVAAGDNIMAGYWKDTTDLLDDNWYHTGDQAYEDEDGCLYITGRKDDLLKVGGHRINTREIEDVLMATGFVLETTVFGLPDKLLGHKLIALVMPRKKETTETQILGECAARLPKYKLPGVIKLVRSIPKKNSGKIDRNKCLELMGSTIRNED
ncbi:MAG: acyl--CoA ligase [Deltaproteobacteria bacterium]|nr:acyl--CoA ligase [Deltaproteobacteria bacterium]